MHYLALQMTECLIRNKVAESVEREDCINGIETFLNKVLVYGTILIIALLRNELASAIIFLVFLTGLRARTGGIHANTRIGCCVGSVMVYVIISAFVEPFAVAYLYWTLAVAAVSSLIILVLSPVNHPNLMLNDEEKRACKMSTFCVLVLEVLAIWSMMVIRINRQCISYAALGIICCAVLMIAAKAIRQEVRD